MTRRPIRLLLIFSDQLDWKRFRPRDYDVSDDVFWMAEDSEEHREINSNKHRIGYQFSAMRHFRNHLQHKKLPVIYHELKVSCPSIDWKVLLRQDLKKQLPRVVSLTKPGDRRTEIILKEICKESGIELETRPDEHFLCSEEKFLKHASQRKQLRLEFFYREMRREYSVLTTDERPTGGSWNFDKENRESFDKTGPDDDLLPRYRPSRDAVTEEVMDLVNRLFPTHPGDLNYFGWPVTPTQAEAQVDQFMTEGLPNFGRYQDAMWSGQKTLFHSLLAAPLNSKLIDPLMVVRKAETAYREGRAPLAGVEGFIRQILGWREYVRGIYNLYMPSYRKLNFFDAREPLPDFFWTGKTEMACLRHSIQQVLDTGYSHHIQRLMVIGLFALLWGVDPKEINNWFLAGYTDAMDWVTTPNVIGMSQYADGGIMSSKPYSATGSYINKMSNYCQGCPYDPKKAVGPKACPITTLYWNFLLQSRTRLAGNQRMGLQFRNLERMDPRKISKIRTKVDVLKTVLQGAK